MLPRHEVLELVCGDEARAVGVEGGEGLLGLVSGRGRPHQRLAPGEQNRQVSLRAQQPDRPLGALQVLPDLKIPGHKSENMTSDICLQSTSGTRDKTESQLVTVLIFP